MKNKLSFLTVFLVSLIALCGIATALPVSEIEVKVNGDEVKEKSSNYVYDFQRADDLEVKVRLRVTEDIEDVQVEASLRGYDHNDLMEDITDVFDMKTNVTYTKELSIPLRQRMDQDTYTLRIRVEDRNGETSQFNYELEVDAKRHELMIKDVILSPENEVKAGRALLASVLLRNYGEKDEDSIKVKVSIPELGVSATDYVDELEKDGDDDQTKTEELYMRIPQDAQTGEYALRVEVTYDDGDEREVKETLVKVVGACDAGDEILCPPKEDNEKTVITLASGAQTAVQGGSEAVYPITLTNQGTSAKTYVVNVDGADWAGFRVSPSNVVLVGAGESKAVNVYVAAGKEAPVGQQSFSVTISSAEKTLKEIPMKVSVEEGKTSTWSKLKRGLEIALVVLVVLLVILGLVIGFNKLKGDDDDSKEDGETYY